MSDPLEAVKLKIERANGHIPEVKALIDFLTVTATDSYEVLTEVDPERKEVRRKFRLLKPPPGASWPRSRRPGSRSRKRGKNSSSR